MRTGERNRSTQRVAKKRFVDSQIWGVCPLVWGINWLDSEQKEVTSITYYKLRASLKSEELG